MVGEDVWDCWYEIDEQSSNYVPPRNKTQFSVTMQVTRKFQKIYQDIKSLEFRSQLVFLNFSHTFLFFSPFFSWNVLLTSACLWYLVSKQCTWEQRRWRRRMKSIGTKVQRVRTGLQWQFSRSESSQPHGIPQTFVFSFCPCHLIPMPMTIYNQACSIRLPLPLLPLLCPPRPSCNSPRPRPRNSWLFIFKEAPAWTRRPLIVCTPCM